MTTPINYEDLYEEFLHYTSDSHSSTSPDPEDSSYFQYDNSAAAGVVMSSDQQQQQEQEQEANNAHWIAQNQKSEHHENTGTYWTPRAITVSPQSPPPPYQLQPQSSVIMSHTPMNRRRHSDPRPSLSATITHQDQDRNLNTPIPCTSTSKCLLEFAEICNQKAMLATDPNSYPGGIEVIWKGVPQYCKTIISQRDVPNEARERGYFTVAELLVLKRSLLARYNAAHPSAPIEVKEAFKPSEHCPSLPKRSKVSSTEGTGCPVVMGNPSRSSSQGRSEDRNWDSKSVVRRAGALPGLHPPPPYRTATLVLKLLQVGNYFFRSFSEVVPNRLRVMFNTQHLTYECQLPVTPPLRETFQPLRKVLTIDVAFDQISMITFGTDKILLRVDGAPQLTVTYNPVSQGDMAIPSLTPQDQFLLEQIDKGLLRLSPCHQLSFLNERMVHALKCQFKEYPKFRDMQIAEEEKTLSRKEAD